MLFNDDKVYSLFGSQSGNAPGEPITGVKKNVNSGTVGYIVNHISSSIPSPPPPLDHRHVGYGKYKLTVVEWGHIFVDFSDANYGYSSGDSRINDIILEYDGDTLLWASNTAPGNEYQLSPGETIEIWDQTRVGNGSGPQNKNGFKLMAGTILPQDGSDAVVTHITPGKLFVNLEVQADATVLSGKTFTVEAGNTVTFDNNKKLTVNGTLDVNGTTANPVTFTASGTSWNGLYFASGSSGTLSHCTMDKLSGGWGSGAITISNSSPSFTDCTIDVLPGSYVYGVSASGSGSSPINPIFYQSTIRSASGPALYASGSAGYISVHDSEIIQNSGNPALRAAGSSSPAGRVLSSNPTRMLSLSRRQQDTEFFSLCAPRLCEML